MQDKSGDQSKRGAIQGLPKCAGEGGGCRNRSMLFHSRDILSPNHLGGTIHHGGLHGNEVSRQSVGICMGPQLKQTIKAWDRNNSGQSKFPKHCNTVKHNRKQFWFSKNRVCKITSLSIGDKPRAKRYEGYLNHWCLSSTRDSCWP